MSANALFMGRKARTHSALLDVTVRTDTVSGVMGGCRGVNPLPLEPTRVIRCTVCNRPLNRCKCVVGRDY